mgnify:CR=1 FL=1
MLAENIYLDDVTFKVELQEGEYAPYLYKTLGNPYSFSTLRIEVIYLGKIIETPY